MIIFYLCLNVFLNAGMDLGHPSETLHGNGDHDGIGDPSWVSVCPRGLWKVQIKQTHKGSQQTVSNSGDDACMTLL